MGYSLAYRNAAVDAVALDSGADWFSLHTVPDPGVSGASEVTGGTPAYARKQGPAAAAANGSAAFTTVTFDVPAGVTVAGWARYTTSTGGTPYAWGPLPGAQPFLTQGTYTLTDVAVHPS